MKEILKKYRIVWMALIISWIIEVFVCNYGFFRTLLVGKSKEVEYTIEKGSTIKIDNINQRVTSIRFYYPKKLLNKVTYEITMKTEDRSEKVTLKTKDILQMESQVLLLDTHTNCEMLEIKLQGVYMAPSKIQINQPVFRLNVFRVVFLFLGCLLILAIKEGKVGQKEYEKESKRQKRWDMFLLTLLCIGIASYTIVQENSKKILLSPEAMEAILPGESVNCISMQAEAFLKGKVELSILPNKELIELSNPYNCSLREEKNIHYLYDVAYYNGKYYNYYGVSSILTSILPFRLLTGNYLPLYLFNLLYIAIAIFSLYALYRKLIHRWVGKVSRFDFYLGFFTIVLASNLLILIRGLKYDIGVTSGIAFLLLSLNLAMSLCKNRKTRIGKLILLGITIGLLVLSKPNYICYYGLIFFFFWKSIHKFEKKEKIQSIIITATPLVILGIFQMILNVLRFDNILEFGAKYQLTVDDMRVCMNLSFGKILEGFSLYLGKMPQITPNDFPFISLSRDLDFWGMNERCYMQPLIGLIYIPVFWIYFFAKEILKNGKKKEIEGEKECKHFIALCIITAVILIILNTCCGGIMESYSIDFKLILSIGAIILMLKAIQKKQKEKWIHKAFYLICFATIFIMLPIGLFENCQDWGLQPITIWIKNTMEFWR